MNPVNAYIRLFFDELNDLRIPYVVLHDFDPNVPPASDIDFCIDDRNGVVSFIIQKLVGETGFYPVNRIDHETGAHFYVVTNGECFIFLDTCFNFMRQGRVILTHQMLVNNRIWDKDRNVFCLDKNDEFVYKVLKRILKKDINALQMKKLVGLLVFTDEHELKRKLMPYLGVDTGALLEYVRAYDIEGLNGNIDRYSELVLLRTRVFPVRNNKVSFVRIINRLSRLFRPTGLIVCDKNNILSGYPKLFHLARKSVKSAGIVSNYKKWLSTIVVSKKRVWADLTVERTIQEMFDFMNKRFKSRHFRQNGFICICGTDGAGKSSVIDELRNLLKDIAVFHLRPKALRNISDIGKSLSTGVVDNPHGKAPHNLIKSVIAFSYYFFDYTLGFLIKVYPLLLKGRLVVFDRYYYDYYVDKKRFRTSLSDRWFCFWERFIPKPKFVFYLDGSPELFMARKQEVSLIELASQINTFRSLCGARNNFYSVDASQTPVEIAKSIVNIMIMEKA